MQTADSPIFQSVEQALHVSFMMEILPVRERSQMEQIIAQLMRECGVREERESYAWTVNFSGLTPLEVRAQCAMIRGVVKDHLPHHQACAVWARWGHQATKAEGVRGVVEYCGALLSVSHPDARLAMGWAIYGTEAQRREITAAEIVRGWSLSPRTVRHDIDALRISGRALQSAAVSSLDAIFSRGRVCEAA